MKTLVPIKMIVYSDISMYARTDEKGNPYTKLSVNDETYKVYGYIQIEGKTIKFKQ